MRALVMAGGEGRRLKPITSQVPKVLLEIKDRPILEHVLLHLRSFGITDVTLAVAYLAPMVQQYFGTGTALSMKISYLQESVPLGTAGALSLLSDLDETLVMTNGDILTDLNFSVMLEQHRRQQSVLTIASKVLSTDLSLGVLDTDERGMVIGYREKPRLAHRFSLGMYIVEPVVRSFIRQGERIDVPDLISRLLSEGKTIASYDHKGEWIDIGRPEDFSRAKQFAQGMGA